jgi:hypothetical protein
MSYLTYRQLSEGPWHIDTVLSHWNVDPSAPSPAPDKDPASIQLLNTGAILKGLYKNAARSFLTGYLYEKAAQFTGDIEHKKALLEKSLSGFGDHLGQRSPAGEVAYYARLAYGFVSQALGIEWPRVEVTYLSAFERLPARGESIQAIVQYYCTMQEWPIAYIYSMILRNRFFGRPPSSHTRWGFDARLYTWVVLHQHIAICSRLRKHEEAWRDYQVLLRCTELSPQQFGPGEIEKIRSKRGTFQNQAICQD